MTLSICISTYKRAELLKKLLDSILVQKNIDDYFIEIIVVENDIEKNALPVIESFNKKINDHPNFSIKYDIQPIKNIALTRNKTVELATGDFIFFIDDDEYADEFWINNHLKALNNHNADATFGNVLPYFENDTPDYIKNCYVYNKINKKTGFRTAHYFTSNTLVKSDFLFKNKLKFNLNYGLTGGEDNNFFNEMNNLGAILLSASEALVFEFIPKERANIRWLIKRVFRTGNNYTRTLINMKNEKNLILCFGQFFKALAQTIIALLISVFFLPINRTKSLNWFLKSVSNLAKPFAILGYFPKEYNHKKK